MHSLNKFKLSTIEITYGGWNERHLINPISMYFLWFIPLWRKGHHVDATFSLFVGNWIALNWFCIEGIFLCWNIVSNVMLHCYEPGHCWRGWVMKRNVSKLTYSHHSLLTPAALPILEWNNNGERKEAAQRLFLENNWDQKWADIK